MEHQQGSARVNPNVNRFNAGDDDNDDDDDDDDYNIDNDMMRGFNTKGSAATAAAAAATNKPATRSSAARGAGASKIHTLRDGGDDEDDEGNEGNDKGQAFYAGGSETSGQQIIGPPKKNADHIIKDLFRKAKE